MLLFFRLDYPDSFTQKRQIHNAAQHPVELDRAQADAVEARTLLDLRIGAAFTRMQTLTLQGRFAQLNDKRDPVSYGMLHLRPANLIRLIYLF